MKIKPLPLFYVFLPLSYYYLGPALFITYAYALKSFFSKWKVNVVLTIFPVLGFFFIILFKQDFLDGLYVLRFFWGWVFFYLFFSSGYRFDLLFLLRILSVLVVAEAVIINTAMSAADLPNYPDYELARSHFSSEGMYQRPYSFGGSASVTSAILVSIMAYLRLNLRESFLPITAIISCMSGTGFFLLFLLSIFRLSKKIIFFLLLPLASYVFFNGELVKFSIGYSTELFDLKLDQYLNSNIMKMTEDVLFGGGLVQVGSIGGDFQFLSFLDLNGIIGLFIVIITLVLNLNRLNWFPILIILLGTLHYGVLFYLPGQFFFGYFLSMQPFQHQS